MGCASLLGTRSTSLLLCSLPLHCTPVPREERSRPPALQVFRSHQASVRDLQPWLTQGQDSGVAAPAVLNFDSLRSLPAAKEAGTKGATMKSPAPLVLACLRLDACRGHEWLSAGPQNVPDAVVQQVAGLLQAELGLLLFGFDLIMDAEGGPYQHDSTALLRQVCDAAPERARLCCQ